MSKERDMFIDVLKNIVGEHEPTKKQTRVSDIADNFYKNLRGGDVCENVTKTMVMYIHRVLPMLSMQQTQELNTTVHTMIMTVLTYLVEDGLIKEE